MHLIGLCALFTSVFQQIRLKHRGNEDTELRSDQAEQLRIDRELFSSRLKALGSVKLD